MSSFQKITAFIIGVIFYAYVLLTRNLPVIVSDMLCQKFHLSEAVFGQYRGTYFLTYCLAHLPLAYCLDRFSLRWIMSISIALCVIGLMPMIWSDSVSFLIAGRMILGLGSSAAILSVFKINRSYFPPRQFATLLGIAGTTGYISSVVGLGPLKRLFVFAGYHNTILGIIIFGCLLAAASYMFLTITNNREEAETGFWERCQQLTISKSFWTIAVISGLMVWGMEGFADGWSIQLLYSFFNIPAMQATDITSLVFAGFAVGSIIVPIIVSYYDNSKQLIGLCGLGLAGCLLGLFIPGLPFALVICLYFMLGVFSCYQVLCLDWAGKIVPPSLSMISSAATNMLLMSFGYPFHTISALLMNGKGVVAGDCAKTIIYTRTDLLIGLAPFVVCAIAAYVINCLIPYKAYESEQ